jgi:hypothetical protein
MHLLNEVQKLNDTMLDQFFSPVAEQSAFSLILTEKTQLRSARDTIYHYCVSPDRRQFGKQLPTMLASIEGVSPKSRADWLYA